MVYPGVGSSYLEKLLGWRMEMKLNEAMRSILVEEKSRLEKSV